jgi:hypothetical protein
MSGQPIEQSRLSDAHHRRRHAEASTDPASAAGDLLREAAEAQLRDRNRHDGLLAEQGPSGHDELTDVAQLDAMVIAIGFGDFSPPAEKQNRRARQGQVGRHRVTQ